MYRFLGTLGVIVVAGIAPSLAQEPGDAPAKRLKALMEEYQGLMDVFDKAYQNVKGEAQATEFYAKNHPKPEQFYPRMMLLAQKYPKDGAAVDALAWIVMHSSPEPKDQATQRKALDILRRDYLASEKLSLIFDWADDEFLQAVREKSPHRHVRGLACYTAAEHKLQRVRHINRWRNENPDWRQRKWLLSTGLAYLVTTDIDRVTKEAENLLDQVLRDFADVPIEDRRNGRTLGDLARGHLHEIRHLAIGMRAPSLKSVDLDGKPVRLADLKGKVVVLDVWATWCGPCKAMIPHEREMVKRLSGKPFTLVSISVDDKRETLTAFLAKEPMPWTHWYNGPEGHVIADLNVWSYPTIYVLDAKGVIRYKDVRGKLLEQAVSALLEEVENGSPPK